MIEPASVEGMKRTNAVIVCPNQQVMFALQQDLYTMDVNRGNRNCYNCREFGH